jgi:hypothetical protein
MIEGTTHILHTLLPLPVKVLDTYMHDVQCQMSGPCPYMNVVKSGIYALQIVYVCTYMRGRGVTFPNIPNGKNSIDRFFLTIIA